MTIDQLGTVKGFYLVDHVEKVRRAKGEEGVKKLKELVPDVDIDHLSKVRDYPIEDEIKLLRAAAEIIFGKEDEEVWFKLGRMDFDVTVQSSFGKIAFILFAKNPKQLVKNAVKIFGFFISGPKISCFEETDEKALVRVEKNPYPKEYYQGLFTAAIEYIGCKPKVEVKVLGPRVNEYIVYFEKK